MNFIAEALALLTRVLYDFFGNYGLSIIALTVIIRSALVPLNIMSQKSMIKTQALSSKQNEIMRKYPNDKQKQNEELQKVMQENGTMGCTGCILPFLQIFFIWPIYRIVSQPLLFIAQVSKENIANIAKIANMDPSVVERNDIQLLNVLNNNGEVLNEAISKGYIKASQLIDLDFFGIDLTLIPSINPITIMERPEQYLPLLLIPIIVVITSILSNKLIEILRPDYKQKKEAKERAKRNKGAGTEPQNQAELMSQMMIWMMPIMMVITTFMLPAALGLYWVVGGIMGIVSQLLVYFMFTKPFENKKRELEEAKKHAFDKKDDSKEDKDSKKNKGGKKSKK